MDYSSLKTSIANWMVRSDLDDVVDDFIEFAMARLNQELRLQVMERELSETISDGTIDVPEGALRYLSLKHAYLNTVPVVPLERVDPDMIYRKYPNRSATGRPTMIAREGEKFIFGPYPDSAYTVKVIYYTLVQSLGTGTSQATTNWFTSNTPGLLLAACCVEASKYTKDDALIRYETMYQSLKSVLERMQKRERTSGRGLSMRLS